jgi:hypothetical protein
MASPKTNDKTGDTKARRIMGITAILVGLVALIGLVWTTMALLDSPRRSTVNYAEEVAEPLEQGLMAAGAVRKCSSGDDGSGSDNVRPWYNVVFETSLPKAWAIKLALKVAGAHGYKPAYEQSPYEYIDWYLDKTSKQTTYSDLQPGKIELGINVYSGGDNLDCAGATTVTYDAENAAVVLNLLLPQFKR